MTITTHHTHDNAPAGDIKPGQVINPWTNSFELSWKSNSLFSPDAMISIDGRSQFGQIKLSLSAPKSKSLIRSYRRGKPINFFLLDTRFSGKITLTKPVARWSDNRNDELTVGFKTLGPIKSTGNHKIEFETIF